MRILLTNDDGIHAEGLKVLERIAATLSDDVWVVAPETDQSGLAHSLTLSEPLRLRKEGDRRFALRGTPTDCVIMGVREVMDSPPDLVLSGVNAGQNIAEDVSYSGTVAGAIEGTLLGIRSIALSQAFLSHRERRIDWETVGRHAPALLKRLIDLEIPRDTFLNVNFPPCGPEAVAGVKVASQARRLHGLSMEKRADGRGFPYYWLRFSRDAAEDVAPGTDVEAMAENRISVTPLKLDMTDYKFQAHLAEVLQDAAE
ncbi:5'/3'-nucleotidase SurE [Rhizobium sp. EC-SD404]|uniref:5'/3'-nucleotidase SurE n=1 Tax=Rhizobium sp. EC-SD404 TaxID=2038389 RepID=UPI001258C27E|nr:5'/3'-nucleotidase SurE [Rhizobium sp. EC-SD404]VVT18042.1 5'-nucleotidase SurE [Rhizobium sp. EC-SD404]